MHKRNVVLNMNGIIEYMSANLWQAWVFVAVICLIIELFTVGFFMACFAVGALFAIVVSFFCGLYGQLLAFIVASGISIFLVRPMALKYLRREGGDCKTNADALIGRNGVVSRTIEAGGYGRVVVGGDDWKAEADSAEEIPEGTRVTVIGRESIIIKVTKL